MIKKPLISRGIAFFIDLSIGGFCAILVSIISEQLHLINFAFHIGMLSFLFKDFFSAEGSLGKVIVGLVLTDADTGCPLKATPKFLRNLFLLIYPLEILVLLFNDGKRIGDVFLKSRVIPKSI